MSVSERRAPKRWTEEEDRILWAETQKQSRAGNVKDWNRIAAKLPSRTNKDCRKRWVNTLCGSLKKGAWDEDEDERLVAAINAHGQRWTLVANEVGCRSPDQCAKRWQHNLDPKLEHRGWTEAEVCTPNTVAYLPLSADEKSQDELLLASVAQYGREWKLIQEQSYNTRSRNDLKNRYSILTRRRDSASTTHSAQLQQMQQHGNLPSTPASSGSSVSTPGKGSGDVAAAAAVAIPETVLMQDLEAGSYSSHDPAYLWGGSSAGMMEDDLFLSAHHHHHHHGEPGSCLDATSHSNNTALASMLHLTDDASLCDTETADSLYSLPSAGTTHHSTWADMGTGGESSLYGDINMDFYSPSTELNASDAATTTATRSHGSVDLTNDPLMDESMRRVSLVVDECDWDTLNYLLDVTKSLKGKVKVEMDI